MAYILLCTCPDGKLLFTALTESAEYWMGETKVRLATGRLALDYEAAALGAGLKVDAVIEWTERRAATAAAVLSEG